MPNPIAVRRAYLDAALSIEKSLEAIEGADSERLARMRRLGGPHHPPGGPALKNTGEVIVYLAEALDAVLEHIAEPEKAPAHSRKRAATK